MAFDLLLIVERQVRSLRLVGGPRFRLWHDALFRWDAYYYQTIATSGYPTTLPIDAHGAVLPNSWAFFPAFPLVAGALARTLHLNFVTAAVVLNLAAGAVAAVAIAMLAQRVASRATALRAVAILSCLPASFVLQVPYAEAAYLALATACLVAITERRRGSAALLLIGTALTRGYVIPLSAAAFATIWMDVRGSRASATQAEGSRQLRTSLKSAGLLAACAIAAPILWIAIAAFTTGRVDAYVATQRAWGYVADPFMAVGHWRDEFEHVGLSLFWSTPVLVLFITAGLTAVCCRLPLPRELKVYTVGATLFLFAVAQPGAVAWGSTPRFAFGIVTLPLIAAMLVKDARQLAVLLAGSIALEYLWILNIWSGRAGIAP